MEIKDKYQKLLEIFENREEDFSQLLWRVVQTEGWMPLSVPRSRLC